MAQAAAVEEAEVAMLATATITGKQRQQTTAGTSQVRHGKLCYTTSNSTSQ